MSAVPILLRPAARGRRALAFAVDYLLLAFVGWAVATALFTPLALLGPGGIFVGFAIVVLYFGFGDSDLFRGQTLGKRLLRLRVVRARPFLTDAEDAPQKSDAEKPAAERPPFALYAPPVLRHSLLRAAVLTAVFPGVINGILFAQDFFTLLLLALAQSTFFLVAAYLFLFNLKSGQTLHDFAGGAYVIAAEGNTALRAAALRPWAGHGAIVAAIVFLMGVWPAYYFSSLHEELRARAKTSASLQQWAADAEGDAGADNGAAWMPLFANYAEQQRALRNVAAESEKGGAPFLLFVTPEWRREDGGEKVGAQIFLWSARPPQDGERAAARLARHLLAENPTFAALDFIKVHFTRGVNIALWSSFVQDAEYSRSPQGWTE